MPARSARPVPAARVNRRRPVLTPPGSAQSRFREQHNPLRGLTLAHAVSLLESYPRGDFADLMWTLGAPVLGIETADSDLSAILSRRIGALVEMDWNAKPKTGERIDPQAAADQAAAVHDLIDGIDNLYTGIAHLAGAVCRGFAHCEIIEGPGDTVAELRPVDQWHLVRDGIYGPWKYNPEARQTTYRSLSTQPDLPLDRFLLRQVQRPILHTALVKHIRSLLSEADWGAFSERYGLANGLISMPPDVDSADEAYYLAAAQSYAAGGTVALPDGARLFPNNPDKGSGTAPFRDHLDYWTEKLVLVGTGGLLTMLAESGSGTLAGNAHADTFDQLARADARDIGEIINRQLVIPWLARRFPGQPDLAYFEIAFREEVETSEVVEDAATLAAAGTPIHPADLAEKTGYRLQIAPPATGPAPDDLAGGLRGLAAASGAENRVITAQKQTPPSESITAPKIDNRETRNFPAFFRRLFHRDPEPAEPAAGDDLDALLAALLAGGPDRIEATLAAALAQGLDDQPAADTDTDTDV